MPPKDTERTPLKRKMMETQFSASWPSVTVSNIRLRHYGRKVVAAYSVLSIVAVIVNSAAGLDESYHVVRGVAIGAGSLMAVMAILEMDVCGLRSLVFSASWCGLFCLIAYAAGDFPGTLYGVLISLPPIWWCTTSLFRVVASCLIVPAQFTFNGMNGRFKSLRAYDDEVIDSGRKYMVDYFGAEPVLMTSPDHVTIDAMFFPSPLARSSNTFNPNPSKITTPLAPTRPSTYAAHPTIIMVNANNESYELKQADIEMYLKHGFSLMSFNYRGVSRSEGTVTRDGTVLDCNTAYQYVHKVLGVPSSMIILAGSSLGGAVATEVAAMHPGAHLINDRSFSDLTIEAQCVAPAMFGFDPESGKGRALGLVLSTLVAYCGWNYPALHHWRAVKGPKFLVHHPEDGIIAEPARLYTALKHEATLRVLHLSRSRQEEECERAERGQVAHCRPFTAAETAKHMQLIKMGLPDSDLLQA